MVRYLFIVQGEGKGHMSQAMALKEYLDEAGHRVEAVFLGTGSALTVPAYFKKSFPGILQTFKSPHFLRTPNMKGIYVGRTILYNLFHALVYIKEIARIRREIEAIQPDVVVNFYDMVGALAMRNQDPGIRRIGIGHHFYLHLNSRLYKAGPGWHRFLLENHTRLIMNSCDRVLALSFRKEEGSPDIRVLPPLVRKEFREMKHVSGNRYLVYLLNEGFLYDLLDLARNAPGFEADVFTSLNPGIELPEGITLHPFDAKKFSNLMASCRGLITTAGFDTVAEAACQGIPLAVIPSQNHYEQRCNGADIEEKGIGVVLRGVDRESLEKMGSFNHGPYRKWVDLAGELIIKSIEE